MRTSKTVLVMTLLTLGMLSSAVAQAAGHVALPYPSAATPKAIDRGALKAQSGTTPISVTVALSLPKLNEAEALLKSLNTRGDPQYHKFLTADQFVARFAPTSAEVAKVIAALAKYGLAAERTTATTLKVTGLPADMERAFAVSLHSYEVPAHENVAGYTFHAPLSRATIPAEISASVAAVVGLDSRPSLRPLHFGVPAPLPMQSPLTPAKKTGNPFGSLTVVDFANNYDVQPLYRRGVSGRGKTIGIMTFASFTPSDAFAYWSSLGLSVNPNRVSIVNVSDGVYPGPGAPSDMSGSLETTLDVEQSGGIAPGANIIVYQANNSNQGFVNVIAAAVDANSADSLSMSWGSWEWFDNLENSPITDPITGKTVGETQAGHELLVRAAIQGQAVFAASGDNGAYEANGDLGCFGPYSSVTPFSCSLTLSVIYPGSDPAITAAGGTTLPGTQEYCLNTACTPPYYTINIRHEQVWGWDYLEGLCNALGTPNPITCKIFPGGTGGGVSIIFSEPDYQFGVRGTQRSQPGQIFQAQADWYAAYGIPPYYALPSYFPGRNVPDVSFNADPETGYVIYYTSSVSGFGLDTFYGGTSFVAPELNGVSALLGEYTHGRLGLLNDTLYDLGGNGQGNWNQGNGNQGGGVLNAIAYGDNWFYHGSNGYNPAAGLGTLDVWNFAQYLRDQY